MSDGTRNQPSPSTEPVAIAGGGNTPPAVLIVGLAIQTGLMLMLAFVVYANVRNNPNESEARGFIRALFGVYGFLTSVFLSPIIGVGIVRVLRNRPVPGQMYILTSLGFIYIVVNLFAILFVL